MGLSKLQSSKHRPKPAIVRIAIETTQIQNGIIPKTLRHVLVVKNARRSEREFKKKTLQEGNPTSIWQTTVSIVILQGQINLSLEDKTWDDILIGTD